MKVDRPIARPSRAVLPLLSLALFLALPAQAENAAVQPAAVGLVLSGTSATVPEGGTATYTVKLESQPTATVTVTVARKTGGDTDLTVDTDSVTDGDQDTLTFTTTDWNTAQTVTLQAAQDDDHANGEAVFGHEAGGGGYDGARAEFTATEGDDDSAGLVFSKAGVTVPEGGTAAYTVRLATRPGGGTVKVTVARESTGQQDTDLSVKTGATLYFSPLNWNAPRHVFLQANNDSDALHGTAAFVHTASGADYGGVSKELTATEADDEVSLVLSKTSIRVPEGGTATYTVKLENEPSATVTVTVARKTGGDTDLTVDTDSVAGGNQSTLTFTTTDWNTAQMVTLAAADDTDDENGVAVFTHTASGGQYTGTGATLTAVEAENELGMTISPAGGLKVPEAGGWPLYYIRLNTKPSDDVTVTVAKTGDENIAHTIGTPMTFTEANWDQWKERPVSASADDDDDDGVATLTHTANGGGYVNVTAALTATEADKDRKFEGIPTSVNVGEGSSYIFKVGLFKDPTGTVTVTVTKNPGAGPTLAVDTDLNNSGNQNTFTLTKNYLPNDSEGHGSIKVTASEDDDGANFTVSDAFTITATGDGYDGLSKSFGVNVTDNDTKGLAPFRGLTDTKTGIINSADTAWVPEGGTLTVPLRLASRPNGTVTVTATGNNNPNNFPWLPPHAHPTITVDLDTTTTGDQNTMTFTALNWDTPQDMVLSASGDNDDVDTLGSFKLAVSSTVDTSYSVNHQLNVRDADTGVADRTLTLSKSSVKVNEGGTATYTVVLASEPTETVTVTVARTSGDGDLSVKTGTALTFTDQNWDTPQTVTLAAREDLDFSNGSAMFTHTAAGGAFTGATATLTATEEDNDIVSGAAIDLSPTTVTAPEGGTVTYTVALAAAPVGSVTVAVMKNADGDPDLKVDTDRNTTGDQDTLTFTDRNWSTAQMVTVIAVEDVDKEAGEAIFTHTATGGGYGEGANATVATLTATEEDNDLVPATATLTATEEDNNIVSGAAIDLSPTTVTAPEGGTVTYAVALATAPTGSVTVAVTKNADGDPDLSVKTGATLTFTDQNWSTPQTVTLAAREDLDFSNGSAMFTHTATGGGYGEGANATVATLTATEEDNDIVPGAAIDLSPTTVTAPEGGTVTYTVALATAPAGSVTVAVTKNADGDPDLSVKTGATLTFTDQNWSTPQTVTLAAREDLDFSNGSAMFTHTAAGGAFTGATATLTATEEDNDIIPGAAIDLSPTTVTAPEGRMVTYTVALAVAPVGSVTVAVTKSADGDPDLKVDTDRNTTGDQDTLTFTAQNWSTAQTVAVIAVEDEDKEAGEAIFTHTATGGGYGEGRNATVAALKATEKDNDILVPGRALTLSASDLTAPEGGMVTYTVALAVAPVGSVTVAVTKSADGDPDLKVDTDRNTTGDQDTLTFTAQNWSTAQTVTVIAVEDEDKEAGEAIFTHTATGGGYGEGASATIAVLTVVEKDSFVSKSRERLAAVNEAIMPEMLRAVVQHKIDHVVSRVVSEILPEAVGMGDAVAAATNMMARHGETINNGRFSWREMLRDTDFALPLSGEYEGGEGSVAFWAMGDYLHILDDRPIVWDGDLFGFHLGADARFGPNLRAGLGFSWENGSFNYVYRPDDGGEVAGTQKTRMFSVYPYAGWHFPDGSNFWATAGYGEGEIEFRDDVGTQMGDAWQAMAAAGGTARLAEAEGPLTGGDATLSVRTQASAGRLAVDDNGSLISDMGVSVYGLRAALKGVETIGLPSGDSLTPSLEAGLRWDGGEGETGLGLELDVGFGYADPARGLTTGARGRALVAHTSGLRELGASGWLRLVPDEFGRGWSFEAAPSWGESASGVEKLWEHGVAGEASEGPGETPWARFDTELGYGFSTLPRRNGLLTPYAGLGLTEGGSRNYRVGVRFELGPAISASIDGTRDDHAFSATDHALNLNLTMRW